MKNHFPFHQFIRRQMSALACAALALPLLAQAMPPADGDAGNCGGPMAPMQGHPHEGMRMNDAMPPFMQPAPDHEDRPPFLHGLTLNEEQDDKIFAILHAAAPLLREQGKLVHKSADGMRDLTMSGQYDESRLKQLADTHAKALTEILVLHTRSEHQIFALLTSEQRAQVDAMKVQFEAHGPARK